VRVAGGRDEVTITLRGDLDIATVPDFEERARAVLHLGTARMVLDFARVGFLTSAALGALVRIGKEARRQDCVLVVVNPSPHALHVLQATGLADVLNVVSS
jgi:anti-anti-sigma factor